MNGPLLLTLTGAVVLVAVLIAGIAMEDSSRRFHARRVEYYKWWIKTHYTGSGQGDYEDARRMDYRDGA